MEQQQAAGGGAPPVVQNQEQEQQATPATTPNAPITLPYYFGAPWLPTYSGDANKPQCTTFTEFKNKLKSMFRLYTLNEQQKVEILVGQLTGSALREVISWPTENKKEVDQILKRLSTTFETKTLPELKMKLYARKQQPGETLRDYALSLQETLRAIQAVDKDEVRNADEALTIQFIEGASRESVKTQLRLLKMQMPGKTFLDFKEAAITITGNQSGREEEYPELVDFRESSELMGATASSPERPKRVRDPVVQSSQHPSGDQIQTLRKQMEELTVGMAEIQREMRLLARPPTPNSGEPRWRSERQRSARRRWEPPPEYGRRPSDQFDSQGRPVCHRCQAIGHIERNCDQIEHLNSNAPRTETEPRGTQ
ncbi:uncharacterized protein LOC135044372 [Pseudophryne corroboree]|uniref:uncharacterized protein LOC134909642 n=1 Tax=Pseudophryne corroboree TaxID=495146 RepID=UPI00308131E4